MSISQPCLNCEDRKLNCHSTCELYLKYQDELWERKNTIFQNRQKDAVIRNYKKERIGKEMKRKR